MERETIEISSKESKSIHQAAKRFKMLADSISVASKNFTDLTSAMLLSSIEKDYNTFVEEVESQGDMHYRGDTIFSKIELEDGYKLEFSGNEIVYDEFGTGIVGENRPHPQKSRYGNLNPYNSGPWIVHNPVDEEDDYWYYKGKDGRRHSTHGVRAGRFIYNNIMYYDEDSKSKSYFARYLADAADEFIETGKKEPVLQKGGLSKSDFAANLMAAIDSRKG